MNLYFFFKYGSPVLLFSPTVYPSGLSVGFPLFGFLLLKKYMGCFLPPFKVTSRVYNVQPLYSNAIVYSTFPNNIDTYKENEGFKCLLLIK
jgi:hypothetical protein